MATLIVSYPASGGGWFDRDYYLSTHLPLSRQAWSRFGLQSAEVLFPISSSQPQLAIVLMRFNDQCNLDAALASTSAARVIGDIANFFTDALPVLFRSDD